MIRKATVSDIVYILEVTKACATHMIKNNIYQWNALYPNENAFFQDIKREELYVLDINNKVQGCITISWLMDEEYHPISWITPNTTNIYIHRLAVHPDYQGQGYAQKLMDYAETFAKRHNAISIRLDTFSKNFRNQQFYEQRGYKKLGDIYFPKQSEHPFHCYELVL
ncbi:GNAT family N-acetyltransferase [Cognatitamlana onchidii]|uniref:GNAT family N-acetyltransferase n=1 Tax=Cognatitamlana onchidii TaxID=2562860 RepID=UPI0010A67F53|nr:GNAT family N-acetyltransferase [Algibacter onchidii]